MTDQMINTPTHISSQWQPIETAPKDGRCILLYDPLWPGSTEGIEKAAWQIFPNHTEGQWWIDWAEMPNNMKPTHWMPLPPRPELSI